MTLSHRIVIAIAVFMIGSALYFNHRNRLNEITETRIGVQVLEQQMQVMHEELVRIEQSLINE